MRTLLVTAALLLSTPAIAATPPAPVEGEVMLPASGGRPQMVVPPQADAVLYHHMLEAMVGRSMELSDFAWLDRKASQYLHERTRTPVGEWALEDFYGQFDNCGCGQGVDERLIQRLKDKALAWAKQFPNSPAPHMVYALLLSQEAWRARGGGFADTVSGDGWQTFHAKLAEELAYLDARKNLLESDPQYYVERSSILANTGAPRAQWQAVLREGRDRFPDYQPLYMAEANLDLPKWGGTYDQLDDLVDEAVARTHKEYGAQFYSYIYARLANSGQLGPNPFVESRLDWPHLFSSYQERLLLHPDPATYRNVFFYACLAGDRSAGRILIPHVQGFMPGLWASQAQIDACKDWMQRSDATPPPMDAYVDLGKSHTLRPQTGAEPPVIVSPAHYIGFIIGEWIRGVAAAIAAYFAR